MTAKKVTLVVILACVVMLGMSASVFGESPGKIAGRVRDAQNAQPLGNVNIEVTGDWVKTGAITDADGNFNVLMVSPGKYKVVFSYLGYKTIEIANVEVESDLTTLLNEAMSPAILPDEVIRIEYEKPPLLPVYEEITDREPEQISSTELKQTVIAAHMEVPIEPGKNVLYCSTFQLAWNMMQDSIIKEDILLIGDPEIARMLNKQLSTTADISEECYLAMVGFLTQEFLDKINRELRAKFGDQAPPEVVEQIIPGLPTFFAYAYLFKNLQFEHVFKVSGEPILFRSGKDTTQLKAFEVESQEQRDQVSVLDYIDDNDFIISLRSKSPEDEIILAKIPPQGKMLATIQLMQDRIAQSSPSKVESDEPVKIPKCDFNIKHSFDELVGKHLKNSGWGGWFISKAVQWTRFRLSEKGIVLKSEARLGMAKAIHVSGVKRRPRHFVFDQPFLICLREKGGRYPYFAMWVDNTELLLAWEE